MVIKNLKRERDSFMDELRAKQAAGTLNEGDRLMLEGETYGWPTPEPEVGVIDAKATQTRELLLAEAAHPGPGAA